VTVEKPRQIAFEVLLEHSKGEEFAEDLLASALTNTRLNQADRGLAQELVFGVVRWQRLLDHLIDSRTGGRDQQPIVRILLRLGLYQLALLQRIPAHAAVHETVECAKSAGLGPVVGFINAFCRKASAELELIGRQISDLESSRPEVRWSHPDWLAGRWQARWGVLESTALMRWNNTPPAVFACVNRLKVTPLELEAMWQAEGVQFAPRSFPWCKPGDLYELQKHPSLTSMSSFAGGGFYIQDPSTLLAPLLMSPQPGEKVLDLCAAPGGKTVLMAQLMNNQGTLIAQDTHRARLEMIRQNCHRLGVTCVRVSTATTVTHPDLSMKFDRILIDAPCSNTGVMRRRVDLRWRITSEELDRLCAVQAELLAEAAPQLRPGGVVAYSTCSLEPEENGEQIRAFLKKNPAFTLLEEQSLFPPKHGVDGAYVAVLKHVALT